MTPAGGLEARDFSFTPSRETFADGQAWGRYVALLVVHIANIKTITNKCSFVVATVISLLSTVELADCSTWRVVAICIYGLRLRTAYQWQHHLLPNIRTSPIVIRCQIELCYCVRRYHNSALLLRYGLSPKTTAAPDLTDTPVGTLLKKELFFGAITSFSFPADREPDDRVMGPLGTLLAVIFFISFMTFVTFFGRLPALRFVRSS